MDQQLLNWIKTTSEKIETKMLSLRERSKDKIPYTTIDGEHNDQREERYWRFGDGLDWWTNGFWVGMLWLTLSNPIHKTFKIHLLERLLLVVCWI